MSIIRLLLAMVGAVVCFVGLLNVWGAWITNENTSESWTTAIVGAVMWLQATPLLLAFYKDALRNPGKD